MRFLLVKKIGMTTVYDEDKGALNVTLLEYVPNYVNFVRTDEKDGYQALQVGAVKGRAKKDSRNFLKLKEFRIESASDKKVGDELDFTQFAIGDKVKVSGLTKAKGFQGGMKRHGFKGSPKSHGHKHDWRAPGSIGSGFPEHVMKGKRMAGRMGGKRASVKNLKVVYLDAEKKILGVKGSVPGVTGRLIEITA
jgi:large subunit ribosomal protein L3